MNQLNFCFFISFIIFFCESRFLFLKNLFRYGCCCSGRNCVAALKGECISPLIGLLFKAPHLLSASHRMFTTSREQRAAKSVMSRLITGAQSEIVTPLLHSSVFLITLTSIQHPASNNHSMIIMCFQCIPLSVCECVCWMDSSSS